MTVPPRPSRRCAPECRDHVALLHAAQGPGEDRDVECRRGGFCRELAERGPAQHDAAHEFRRQVVLCVGDRGRERLDGSDVCRLRRRSARSGDHCRCRSEDAAAIEVDEIEQRPDFVLLGIDPDRHLFRSAWSVPATRLARTQKTEEGTQHPDRDAQFRYINDTARARLDQGLPVVSVDTKNSELAGIYANGGVEWQPAGEPEQMLVHDFPPIPRSQGDPLRSLRPGRRHRLGECGLRP